MRATASSTKAEMVSSTMALRAVATERGVSYPNTALRRGEFRPSLSIGDRSVRFAVMSGAPSVGPVKPNTALRRGEYRFGRNLEAPMAGSAEFRQERSAFAQSPKGGRCLPGVIQVQWAQRFGVINGAVMANQSLNRTLCGGPRLAIISFLAKPGPPQRAVSRLKRDAFDEIRGQC